MHFEKLEQNIIDLVKEEQAKLGYRKECIRLYYPLSSLVHLTGKPCGEQDMLALLLPGGRTTSWKDHGFCKERTLLLFDPGRGCCICEREHTSK